MRVVVDRRRDALVHVIAHNLDSWRDLLEPTWSDGLKLAHCGRKLKVSTWGANRPTFKPVNCIACLAKELEHAQ